MYAVSFDMIVAKLEEHYGNPTAAYAEIGKILFDHNFDWVQGSTYLTQTDNLTDVFGALYDLADTDWFWKCVRDIRAFRVESWSNVTEEIRERGRKREAQQQKQKKI